MKRLPLIVLVLLAVIGCRPAQDPPQGCADPLAVQCVQASGGGCCAPGGVCGDGLNGCFYDTCCASPYTPPDGVHRTYARIH